MTHVLAIAGLSLAVMAWWWVQQASGKLDERGLDEPPKCGACAADCDRRMPAPPG